jgi:UDP-2,3-diacylglucosamine pyrophosphatase LpxH
VLECAALFISDLHLRSNQCEARELSAFLKLICPQLPYLVGDVIDLRAIRFNAGVSERFWREASSA